MDEQAQVENLEVAAEKKQRKSEIIRGVVSVIIFAVLSLGVSSLLVFLFRDVMKVVGTPYENLAKALSAYIPNAVMLIVFVIRYFKTLKEDIKRLTKKNLLFIGIMTVVAIVVDIAINAALDAFGTQMDNQETVEAMLAANVIPMALTAIIYAPIVEELVFRKALSQIIGKHEVIFVIVSAVLFGLLHAQNLAIIDYAVSGALFAIVYLKTNKNIVASMLVHFINNLFGIILMLIQSR